MRPSRILRLITIFLSIGPTILDGLDSKTIFVGRNTRKFAKIPNAAILFLPGIGSVSLLQYQYQ
jgi:hypothetical protein